MEMRSQSFLGFVHVVSGEDDGAAFGLEAANEFPELPPRLRVESGGRFVEEEKFRIADDRARHGKSLLLTAGEFADAGVGFLFERNAGDGLLGRHSFAEEAAEEGDRFEDGHFLREFCFLQRDAELSGGFRDRSPVPSGGRGFRLRLRSEAAGLQGFRWWSSCRRRSDRAGRSIRRPGLPDRVRGPPRQAVCRDRF